MWQLAFLMIHCLYFGLFLLDFFHYVHFLHANLPSSRYDLFILDFYFRNIFNTTVYFISKIY